MSEMQGKSTKMSTGPDFGESTVPDAGPLIYYRPHFLNHIPQFRDFIERTHDYYEPLFSSLGTQ